VAPLASPRWRQERGTGGLSLSVESSSRASSTENLSTADGGRIAALKLNSGLLQIDRLVAAVLVELSAPYFV
jgi:hypothetical protein